ncbi:hypothetical protein FALBO_13173 [Fusarium albosuccineum]|uniref:Uncharacterized protein n=1 Tax=Fusarium albosuccineum TaxID=1237068 RepID=A0A8H4L2R6_9HYPO|nr:hypothetical protein FALBO_13173 [Fusarium albosuccineum]
MLQHATPRDGKGAPYDGGNAIVAWQIQICHPLITLSTKYRTTQSREGKEATSKHKVFATPSTYKRRRLVRMNERQSIDRGKPATSQPNQHPSPKSAITAPDLVRSVSGASHLSRDGRHITSHVLPSQGGQPIVSAVFGPQYFCSRVSCSAGVAAIEGSQREGFVQEDKERAGPSGGFPTSHTAAAAAARAS